jgi:hypothetical protein
MGRPATKTRVCTKCMKRRALGSFAGSPQCRECRRVYFAAYNRRRYGSPEGRAKELQRGKDRYRTVGRGRRLERKKKLIAMLGGACVCCGYNKSAAALDFHHRDRKKKVECVSRFLAVDTEISFRKALKEARKCDLICANCHREETYPGLDL